MKNNKALAIFNCLLGAAWLVMGISIQLSRTSTSHTGIVYMSIGCLWFVIGCGYYYQAKNNKKTVKYYNDNAAQFVENTINADMSETRKRFLEKIPEGGMILDWGCGSGRDTLAFKEAGYQVEATDASEELCRLASQTTGVEVKNESFDELDAKEKYDGIWACASLLHVGKEYLPENFEVACKALKPGGYMYASFKYGTFEGDRNERYFSDFTETSFARLVKPVKKFEIVEQWVTEDVRPERQEKWLNVILRKND